MSFSAFLQQFDVHQDVLKGVKDKFQFSEIGQVRSVVMAIVQVLSRPHPSKQLH